MKLKTTLLFTVMSIIGQLAIAQSQMELLFYWAPDLYQDMNSKDEGGRQFYTAKDAIVEIDFDGDWNVPNNWGNSRYQVWEQGKLNDRNTPALYGAAYASFVESQKFYFLGYGYYHAGDDSNLSSDRHSNDWEGCVIIIKKDNSKYGSFQGIVSQKHSDVLKYTKSQLKQWNGSHVKMYMSANGRFRLFSPYSTGHGLEAFTNSGDQVSLWNRAAIYHAAEYGDNVTDVSTNTNNSTKWATAKHYNYKLVPIHEVWNRRGDYKNVYASYATLKGGEGAGDGGNPPWEREYLTDPISYFKGLSEFGALHNDLNNDSYVYNLYYKNGRPQTGIANENAIYAPITGQGWNEVGLNGVEGTTWAMKGAVSVQTKGSTFWGTKDEAYFVYKNLSGDGEIRAKVYNVQHLSDYTKAGLMIRESTGNTAKYAFLYIDPSFMARLQIRDCDGCDSKRDNDKVSPDNELKKPIYLRLRRSGNVFTSEYSFNRTNWSVIDEAIINMNKNVLIGLSASAYDGSNFADATFESVSISGTNSARVADNTEGFMVLGHADMWCSNNVLHVNLSSLGSGKIEVFAPSGAKVYSANVDGGGTNKAIALNELVPGMYLVHFVSPHGTVKTLKFFKK